MTAAERRAARSHWEGRVFRGGWEEMADYDALFWDRIPVDERAEAVWELRVAVEMSEDARRISFEAERRRHPELTGAEARLAVLRRLWGSHLAALVPDSAARGR